MNDVAPYYVYLYRDPISDEIRYIGKGTDHPGAGTQRVEQHVRSAANADFRSWIEKLRKQDRVPTIELFPCATSEQALSVEAALISALWSAQSGREQKCVFNKVRGHRDKFVPIGLPDGLADRHYRVPLTRQDVAAHGGALVVYVSSKDFQNDFDDRRGAFPHYDLTEDNVRQRTLGWWQIGRHLDRWREEPAAAPKLLIGITGPACTPLGLGRRPRQQGRMEQR